MDTFIQAMSADQIRANIPPAVMGSAHSNGDVFEVFTVAHEGYTAPQVGGHDGHLFNWPKEIINTLKVKDGAPLYDGHPEGSISNSTDRTRVGKVLKAFIEEGKLKVLAQRFGRYAKDHFMACSLEAKVKIPWYKSLSKVISVEPWMMGEITGIALLREDTMPSFPGAIRETFIKCSIDKGDAMEKEDVKELIAAVVSEVMVKSREYKMNAESNEHTPAYVKLLQEKVAELEGKLSKVKEDNVQLKEENKKAPAEHFKKYEADLDELEKIRTQAKFYEEVDRRELKDPQKKFLKETHWGTVPIKYQQPFDVNPVIADGLSKYEALAKIFNPQTDATPDTGQVVLPKTGYAQSGMI